MLLGALSVSRAQNTATAYQKQLENAAILLKQGMFDKAEKAFKKAIRINPSDKQAYLDLARFKMKQKDWSAAKSSLKKLLKLYPDQIDGHYLMAICDRNDAFGKDIVRRRFLWHWSEGHFQKVIEQDSAYKQVFTEYARLKADQLEYEQAIELCFTQLRFHPQSPDASVEIFDYYDLFLYHGGESAFNPFSESTQFQINWLKKHGTDYDSFFLGEKYRRLGMLAKADSVFNLLLRKKNLVFSKIPLLLSFVRLYYQMNKPIAAEVKYWQAVNSIAHAYEIHFIFNEIFYIMADADIHVRFDTLDDIKRFYRRFWNRKNPLPGMNYNARLAEHYRRLIKAEKNFVFHGQKLTINNPEKLEYVKLPELLKRNKKFNDKGLVYIRYGEPDEKAVYSAADVPMNESWLYYQNNRHPKLIFHFEIATHASPGDWRLISVPTQREMLETRLGWDKDLDRMYMATDEQDYMMAFNEKQNMAGRETGKAMTRDAHSWKKEIQSIPIHLSTAQFRSRGKKNLFDVYLAIPKQAVSSRKEAYSIGWALFNKDWDKIGASSFIEKLSSADEKKFNHGQFIIPFHSETELEKVYVSVFVKELNSTRLGGYKFMLARHSFSQDKLCMSDLVSAFKVLPMAKKSDPFYKHGLSVVPNPRQIFSRSEPVYLYYEIYNLKVADGQSRYRIKQTVHNSSSGGNIFSTIAGLFKDSSKDKISITKEHQGASAVSYEYSAFDFSAFSAGRYGIRILIRDLNSGQATSAKAEIELQ